MDERTRRKLLMWLGLAAVTWVAVEIVAFGILGVGATQDWRQQVLNISFPGGPNGLP